MEGVKRCGLHSNARQGIRLESGGGQYGTDGQASGTFNDQVGPVTQRQGGQLRKHQVDVVLGAQDTGDVLGLLVGQHGMGQHFKVGAVGVLVEVALGLLEHAQAVGLDKGQGEGHGLLSG